MISQDENDFLTDVSPGAPMHNLLKRYWLPVALSSDFPVAESDPQRITVLTEDYVGFRDSAGRFGLLRERCCHRGASLVLGKVEPDGIRCLYHGWKFACDGEILDRPNATDGRSSVGYRQPSFPVIEKAGLIWAYLGPADEQPAFPRYPFFDVPDSHCIVEAPGANANFVQLIEGLVDSSHAGFLHSDQLRRSSYLPLSKGKSDGAQLFLNDQAPELEAEETDFGMRYAALRQVPGSDGEETIARVTAFALPFLTFTAAEPGVGNCVMATPVHSGRTNFFHIFWDESEPLAGTEREAQLRDFVGLQPETIERYGLGRSQRDLEASANKENNWRQDRAAMRRGESFSGIASVVAEDIFISESMGPISQRGDEHLLKDADLGVVQMRRVLVRNAKSVQRGEAPDGLIFVEPPRGLQSRLAAGENWRNLFGNSGRLPAETAS